MTLQRARHVAALTALSLALAVISTFLGASTVYAKSPVAARDGWCKKGEGQSVVVDWGTHPEATPTIPGAQGKNYIVRCLIFMDKSNPQYKSSGTGDPRADMLYSAGLMYGFDSSGLLTMANGIDAEDFGEWWALAGATDSERAWDMGKWQPDPANSFQIISLTKDNVSGHYSVEPQYADGTKPGEDPSDPGGDPSEPGEDPSNPGDDPSEPGEDPSTPDPDPSEPGDDPSTPDPDPSTPGEDPSTPDPSPSSPSGNPSTPDPTRSGTPSAGPSTPKDTPSKQAPTPAPPTQRPTNSVERPDDQGRRNTAVRPNLPTGPNQGRPAQRPLPRLTISSIPQPSLTPSASASASPSPTPTPSSSASMTPSPSGTPLVAAASPSEQAVWGEEHPQRETEEAATANSNAVAWTLGILGVLAAAGIAAFFLVRRKSSGEESQV